MIAVETKIGAWYCNTTLECQTGQMSYFYDQIQNIFGTDSTRQLDRYASIFSDRSIQEADVIHPWQHHSTASSVVWTLGLTNHAQSYDH